MTRAQRRPTGAMPLRGEVLSLEGLEEHAKRLAGLFTLAPAARRGRHDVLPRLEENTRILAGAYRVLAEDVHHGTAIPPAAEWLLDNFHLVELEARAVWRDLPVRYYRTLPKLADRELAGQARIHALALELIRHGDGRLDAERPDVLRRRLSDHRSVDHRRAVGASQPAQACPARRPASARRRHPGQPPGAPGGGCRLRASGERTPRRPPANAPAERLRRPAAPAHARIRPAG